MNASLSDGNETVIDIFILSANSPLSTLLEKQLREEGYYVTLFSDGTHLLETLRNGKPNLLICDTTVPEADSFEVCRQIKADDYLWNIPVLVITGASDLRDLLSVLDCNADNFVAHPFDPPYLLSLIEGTLTVPVERPTPDQIKTQFKIKHDDQVFVVTADRRKLLEFLLSSFEIAVNKSSDLSRAQDDNHNLGTTIRNLEDSVHENTKVIGIINENLKSKEQTIADLTRQLSDREQKVRDQIAAIDQLTRDLSTEKTACEDTRGELQRVEQEKAESLAAHQATIDQLQRQVSELSSELATVKPALEQARSDLEKETTRRKEAEDELSTTTSLEEEAEKALSILTTEFEQLKINLGTEKNRATEAEQELRAVLQAKDQAEQDLTGIINDLKDTAKEQAAALSRLREESGSEIARLNEESEKEITRLREESEKEISRLKEESGSEIVRLRGELESEQARLVQTVENLNAVTAAKEQSESSLQAIIDAGQQALSELQARFDSAQKSAEQKLSSLSGTLAETKAALEAETRNAASRNEDLARVGEEKEKAEAQAETLAGSIRELQEALVQEKNRYRENEARMNGLIQQRDLEIGELRTAHDDTRTALSSHESSLGQLNRELDAAASARMELEGKLQAAEEKIRQIDQDLVSTSEARELDKQKFSSLNDEMERVKTSLEQETLRRQETEDQLRDALSQQQHMEQDLDRLVAETRALHADLIAERRMHEDAKEQNQSLEEQVAALNQEKREAEQAAADLSAEIDQARVALADEWEDHMTDKERLSAAAAAKPQSRPAPFAGVRREAEIIKKRSLIVKTPNIPSEIRPLPKSMVAIDPVKVSEFDTPHIKSVEDLYEDDDDDRKKPAERPVVSIVQEPATEPVRDVLPDVMSDPSRDEDGFFEDSGLTGTDSDDISDDDEDDDDSSGEQNDSAPVSGQNIAFNRAQWLDLLKWSHHCDVLSQDQRMQIVRMGRLIQKGRRLTNKQEEQVLEMIALVQRLGYRIPQ
ncbi:MAG: response regulator [Methanoregula sp.]|nr:response regulator [Methanoregula sp.]